MLRRFVLMTLLFSSACTSTDEIEQPDPIAEYGIPGPTLTGAFPARVRVVCTIVGEASQVTIGKYDEDREHHGAFSVSQDMRDVTAAPEKSVSFASKPGADECFAQAQLFVTAELPATWSIVKSEGFTGHCWRADGWRPCTPGVDSFDSYAYPLHGPGGAIKHEWSRLVDPATMLEQKIDMLFYVVVHAN
jgi:hypothetical protein